ncbi:hypothetical protein G6F55_010559 [Rhizopus delemar]|uniref:Tc1-like transposase DDE domain-containing protein n=1 Tax=Rhizopus delemar TaxID=936053 RepID=A0A9P6YY58_9FUNG|nr:hypothetical protein G6F55_010559 [Rhizopus delemar]KAG1512838.1 hypothetical protein G6F52_010312 [Rhizopus delemar]KAG1554240.1 hypothetical protein G6F49_008131 [Rhizopus delemar]KAG1566804.1 hypothetical protein G6F50_008804 [Rhizopus delemar]
MPKQISNDKRQAVKSGIRSGRMTVDICRTTEASKWTINRIRKEEKNIKADDRGSQPVVVSKITNAIIRLKLRQGPLCTASDSQLFLRSLGYIISKRSVRRPLRKIGLKSGIKNDETKINVWGAYGIRYYWKQVDQPWRSFHVNQTMKHDGESVMFYGCITSRGPGYACRVYDGTMDSKVYTHILSTTYQESLAYYGLKHCDVLFQHDNDPKHNPDLNPIEHVWRHLKLKLSQYDTTPRSIDDLWKRFDKEWSSFTESDIQPYYESMLKRIAAVIKRRGDYTNF